jgi:hypothetical protein
MKDRYIGLVFLALGAFLYYLSFEQIVDIGTSMEGVNSPRFFPRVTLLIMTVFSVILIYQDLTGKGTPIAGKERLISREMVVLFGIAGLFVLSLNVLGYFVSAPLLILVTMLFLGERNWKRIALLSLITPTVMYVFFERILEIVLPVGSVMQRFFVD